MLFFHLSSSYRCTSHKMHQILRYLIHDTLYDIGYDISDIPNMLCLRLMLPIPQVIDRRFVICHVHFQV